MSIKRFIAVRDETCLNCGFCNQFVACSLTRSGCIACGACIKGCPQQAICLEARPDSAEKIPFSVDGEKYITDGPVSVAQALYEIGRVAPDADNEELQVRCGTGGCWDCAVMIDGSLARSCVTSLQEGMEIILDPETSHRAEPMRIVTLMRPAPHFHPSIFTHGCNYNCNLCHNWEMTFSSTGPALNPTEAVGRLNLNPEKDYWVGISGGEPTLNRRWLIETVRQLRKTDPDIRIQLDTNASILSSDYIDELVQTGATDISPDLKASRLDTFVKVCGITSQEIAAQYLDTSWKAVHYINAEYKDMVFMAVSVPCHPRTHSINELEDTARRLASIDPEIPVTLIEYQPAFRLRDWPFVSKKGMEQIRQIFSSAGLQKVIVQGGSDIPRAVDPLDLGLSSEEF